MKDNLDIPISSYSSKANPHESFGFRESIRKAFSSTSFLFACIAISVATLGQIFSGDYSRLVGLTLGTDNYGYALISCIVPALGTAMLWLLYVKATQGSLKDSSWLFRFFNAASRFHWLINWISWGLLCLNIAFVKLEIADLSANIRYLVRLESGIVDTLTFEEYQSLDTSPVILGMVHAHPYLRNFILYSLKVIRALFSISFLTGGTLGINIGYIMVCLGSIFSVTFDGVLLTSKTDDPTAFILQEALMIVFALVWGVLNSFWCKFLLFTPSLSDSVKNDRNELQGLTAAIVILIILAIIYSFGFILHCIAFSGETSVENGITAIANTCFFVSTATALSKLRRK